MKLLNILTEHITLPTPSLLTEAESWVKLVPHENKKIPSQKRLVGRGEFSTNVTENNLSDKFIEKIMNTINNDEKLAQWLKSGQLIMTLASIKSSASNCFGKSGGSEKCNMPVEPTLANDVGGKLPPPPEGGWTGDQAKNLKLAEDRGKNLWQELLKLLPQQGLRINAEPKFAPFITDTGGVNDDMRDTTKYPNAGQYVFVDVRLEKKPKPESQEQVNSREQSRNCLTNMKVVVAYYKDKQCIPATEGKKAEGCHTCNDARFNIFLNGVNIGVANLNNANTETQKDQTGSGRGESRVSTLIVDEEKAQRIANSKTALYETKTPLIPGQVTLSLKGILSSSGWVHNDVPWVTLTTGQGRVIYNQAVKNQAGYTGGKSGKNPEEKLVGPFNPCKKITT